jgi:ABC-2 type transport system ATP-binding protein
LTIEAAGPVEPAAAEQGPAWAIEAHDLRKTYSKGKVQALRGLSLQVEAGSVFGLLGPNGAGKSTTVKILTTLTRPDSGRATVAGIDVLRQPDRVRRAIGCVHQKSGVDREATGRENLTLQGQIYGMGGKALKSRVGDLLDRFNLAEAANRVVKTYSGGMARRLDIAIGLIHRPRVLFLDEPTTGLDPEVRVDMWDEIGRLARDEHITVLLTTHYLEEADKLAQRLVIIDQGQVVAQGTPEELKSGLGGDAVIVDLADAASVGPAMATLVQLPTAREVTTVDTRTVRTRVEYGPAAVPVVLSALEDRGLAVASVTVARPSLDDVYLQHTGRSFERADREGEAKE